MTKRLLIMNLLAVVGCTGKDGTDGTVGAQGPQGLQGPAGPQGPIGPQGAVGPQGPMGPQGIQGEVGATGPQGADGPIGPAGAAGPRGLVGPMGAVGPQGVPGAVGPAGPAGAQGVPGPRANTLAEYELDDVAGSVEFADSSGLSNVLTANPGAVSAGSGQSHSGVSVTFTGLEGLLAPAGNAIPDSAQVAPEMWIRTGDPGQTATLIEKVGAYRLRMSGGVLDWWVMTTGGPCEVSLDTGLAADTWTHVNGIFDGLRIAVAIDEETRTAPCRSGRLTPTPGGVMTVGGKLAGGVWSEVFHGNLDEVRLRAYANVSIGRPSGTCEIGQAVTGIRADGTLVCGAAAPQRVIRYNVFDSYTEVCCWAADNNPALFGGIYPSDWTDGNAVAWQMSSDAASLRALFNKKVYPGPDALVSSEYWADGTSTDGKVTVALMRIRNDTGSPIDWQPFFYYTSFVDWGEQASVAMNGQAIWNSGDNSGPNAQAAPVMSLPPSQTSTVIFVVPSGPSWSRPYTNFRMTFLAFFNSSLELPQGLSFVDDLDSLQGPIW